LKKKKMGVLDNKGGSCKQSCSFICGVVGAFVMMSSLYCSYYASNYNTTYVRDNVSFEPNVDATDYLMVKLSQGVDQCSSLDVASCFYANYKDEVVISSLKEFIATKPIFLIGDNFPYWINSYATNVIWVHELDIPRTAIPHHHHHNAKYEVHFHPSGVNFKNENVFINNDTLVGRETFDGKEITFTQKKYYVWALENCAPGCLSNWIGDNICDLACNVTSCSFDYGDCGATRSPVLPVTESTETSETSSESEESVVFKPVDVEPDYYDSLAEEYSN